MLREARAAGAPAYEFDPDASPEEKKAQMKAVRDAVNDLSGTTELM